MLEGCQKLSVLEQVSILNFWLSGVGRVSEAARARAGEHIKLQVERCWKGVRSRPCWSR